MKITELSQLANYAYPKSLGVADDEAWEKKLKSKLPAKFGLQLLSVAIRNGAEWFSWRNDTDYFLVCRGTDGAFDWLRNVGAVGLWKSILQLLIGKTPTVPMHPWAWAHPATAGNCKTVQELYPSFQDEIFEAFASGLNVWIVGHSKGGSEARTLASKLAEQGVNAHGVVTFGEPRSMSPGLAQMMSQKHVIDLRFQNCRDVVPRAFVWSWLTRTVKHGGDNIYFDREGIAREQTSFVYQLIDRIGALFQRKEHGPIKDHSMNRYARLIKRWEKRRSN